MPRRCSICSHPLAEALHAEIRPGIPLREVALTFGVSYSSLWRHLRGKHREPDKLGPAKPPAGCAVCRAGPEIRELVLQARRAEKSVRHLAVAVGVSRSEMRQHLRRCVPAAFGVTRCDPSGPQVYRVQAVIDALARLDGRRK